MTIFFVEPLILTLFSALFLRESVGARRLVAVAVGLLGAMIVIRPSWEAFGWAAVLPLGTSIIVASGLYVFLRERRLARDSVRGIEAP
ncbi:hypothetical protein [Halomonas kalidii]